MEPTIDNLKEPNLSDKNSSESKMKKSIFHSVKFYVFCQAFINLSYLVLGAYLKSVITSIEKRFQISSTKAGLISSGFEIGNLLVILPISYLGSRVNRPRAIGVGSIVMMIGGVLLAIPHWIFQPYDPSSVRAISVEEKEAAFMGGLCRGNVSEQPSQTNSSSSITDDDYSATSHIWGLLFFARMLVGIGAAPIQPYGISYMDDHATRSMAPIYMGILLSITMVGPAFGYILGAVTTKYYIDFDRVEGEVNLTPSDPAWIGAWWLGFLVAVGIMFLAQIPFWFFPTKMTSKTKLERELRGDSFLPPSPQQQQQQQQHQELDTKAAMDARSSFLFYARDFLAASLRLLRNGVFILLILAYATLMAISAGFAVFLPKFFEVQFGLSASKSNMYIGGVQMPFGILGVIGGGWAMRRFQLTDRKAVGLSVVASILSLVVGIPLIFVGCDTRPIAGLTADFGGPVSVSRSTVVQISQESGLRSSTNASASVIAVLPPATCYSGCGCAKRAYAPICADGMEYLSPCHAGCRHAEFNRSDDGDVRVVSFSRCACLPDENAEAMPRGCSHQCERKLWTGIGISCAVLFIICIIQSPIYIVLLRSVALKDKSFAIGVQFLIMRTLGWLPAPIYFGSTIDASCILWDYVGGGAVKGACKVYDNVDLRKRYLGLVSGLQCLCVVFLGALLVLFLRFKKNNSNA